MQLFATPIGFIAILIWSLSALVYAMLIELPIAQIIATALGAGCILGVIKISYQRTWHEVKQPWPVWLCGLIGIVGYNFSFVSATKFAPIEQASLIASSTPIIIIILASIFLKASFKLRYIAAAIVGFIGLTLLVTQGESVQFIELAYLPGYLLAFCAALSLAIFTLSLKRYKIPMDMVGLYCGVGAILATIFHLYFETTVTPTLEQWLLMISLGVFMQWLANCCWLYGVMHGDVKRLSISLYTIPVLSIAWLILFGKTQFSMALAISVILICCASLLATPSLSTKTKSL